VLEKLGAHISVLLDKGTQFCDDRPSPLASRAYEPIRLRTLLNLECKSCQLGDLFDTREVCRLLGLTEYAPRRRSCLVELDGKPWRACEQASEGRELRDKLGVPGFCAASRIGQAL
jgi:hypothetical protein